MLSYDNLNLTGYFEKENLFYEIINTREFQRLKKISFLGFLPKSVNSKIEFSRYDHSLGVAYLADQISKKLGFKEKERLCFISTALVHDIGHFPFSHVVDKIILFWFNKTHHFYTTFNIKSKRSIPEILNKYNLRKEVLQIMTQKYNSDNGKILSFFKNPINIDTLDAINRTAVTLDEQIVKPIRIIESFKFKNNKILVDKSYLP